MDKKTRYIANRFLMEMHHNVNLPAEEALVAVLNHYGIHLSDEEFLELLFELRYAFFGIMYYYREKVMRTLLDSGIEINVYGNSWNASPFAKHPHLKIHPGVMGSESLKIMAKELNVPVICLSQLSRGPESRTDKRPMLSDLRESGSIEQDADIVLMLFREEYYQTPGSEEENMDRDDINTVEIIVSKNRHGPVGSVDLAWNSEYTLFTSIEKRDDTAVF